MPVSVISRKHGYKVNAKRAEEKEAKRIFDHERNFRYECLHDIIADQVVQTDFFRYIY